MEWYDYFAIGVLVGWASMFVLMLLVSDSNTRIDQSKLPDGFNELASSEDWALSRTEKKRKQIREARRNWQTCGCGEQIFMMDGFAYNAGYSREFPDRPPLMHGCDFQNKRQRHNMEIQ